ncbi:MAG: hypothetical protein NZ661_04035 [Candidatus Kapabacteria bacterium]|nr:hypothetical protein [Candidatus Kapabacteria bacterium]
MPIVLDNETALEIGHKIWRNECGGSIEGLTVWNRGEKFASLGIGHFIWFPERCTAPFGDTFPQLIDTLLADEEARHHVPLWLREAFTKGQRSCPWKTREEFYTALRSNKMRELRNMLASTVAVQARFIARRLEGSLPKILKAVPESNRERIHRQFYRVARAPMGLYVLADYVNFKGEGTVTYKQYGYHGWGLLQVLQGMYGTNEGIEALQEFTASAEARLIERVHHSPPERHEQRWLLGWKRRLKTYYNANE